MWAVVTTNGCNKTMCSLRGEFKYTQEKLNWVFRLMIGQKKIYFNISLTQAPSLFTGCRQCTILNILSYFVSSYTVRVVSALSKAASRRKDSLHIIANSPQRNVVGRDFWPPVKKKPKPKHNPRAKGTKL